MLALPSILKHSDLTLLLHNHAMYKMCSNEHSGFTDVNNVISKVASLLTLSMRSRGSYCSSLREIQRSVVPYPTLPCIVPSYAEGSSSVVELTEDVFHISKRMAICTPEHRNYLACSLLYRGQTDIKEINAAVAHVKKTKTIQFSDWVTSGFKCVACAPPPTTTGMRIPKSICETKVVSLKLFEKFVFMLIGTERACLLLSNTVAIGDYFKVLMKEFYKSWHFREFVFWYVSEGAEEGEFWEAEVRIKLV